MSNQVNFNDGSVSGSITNPNIINSIQGGIPPNPSGNPLNFFGQDWQTIAGLTGANNIVTVEDINYTYSRFKPALLNNMSQYVVQESISSILNIFNDVSFYNVNNNVPIPAASAGVTAQEIFDELNKVARENIFSGQFYQSFQGITDALVNQYLGTFSLMPPVGPGNVYDTLAAVLNRTQNPEFLRFIRTAMNNIAINNNLVPPGTEFGLLNTTLIEKNVYDLELDGDGLPTNSPNKITGQIARLTGFRFVNLVNNSLANYSQLTGSGSAILENSLFTNFFAQYNVNNPIPDSIDGLLTAFSDFPNNSKIGTRFNVDLIFRGSNIIPSINTIPSYVTNLTSANANFIETEPDDLEALLKTAYANITQDSTDTGFTNAFAAFAKTYPYNSDGSVGTLYNITVFLTNTIPLNASGAPDDPEAAVNQFFNNWLGFLAPIQLAPTDAKSIYLEIYNSFNPSGTQAEFLTTYNAFVTEQKNANLASIGVSYFIPGQSLRAFFLDQQEAFQRSPNAGLGVSPFISAFGQNTNSEKVLILMRILVLIQGIIGTLQQLEAAQVKQLSFLANYQKVYTNIQGQWAIFTKGGQARLSSDTTADVTGRNAINSQINGQFSQNIQAYRNIASDQAKQVQTNVNQTNDAASQQGDTASSILQQLSSLLQSIFR